MTAFKVFVTRKIPESGIKFLEEKGHKVKVYSKDKVITRAELEKGVQWCDALLPLLTDPIDATLMDMNKNLKVIANYAVGFNNIDIKAATERKIPVANTPDVLTDAVADHACTLMMSIARRIVESDKFMRAGKYKGWEPFLLLGSDVKGRTLGIVGAGRIGSAVAERMYKGFGMKIIYYNPEKNPQIEQATNAQFVSLQDLLKQSDFISIHVPLLKETTHLISTSELSMMKKTAYLINTARGPIVDEKALTLALQNNQIAGAGLDVFENEPNMEEGLKKLKNVIVTPHTASATWDAREAMSMTAAQNIQAVADGKMPANLVNKELMPK